MPPTQTILAKLKEAELAINNANLSQEEIDQILNNFKNN